MNMYQGLPDKSTHIPVPFFNVGKVVRSVPVFRKKHKHLCCGLGLRQLCPSTLKCGCQGCHCPSIGSLFLNNPVSLTILVAIKRNHKQQQNYSHITCTPFWFNRFQFPQTMSISSSSYSIVVDKVHGIIIMI